MTLRLSPSAVERLNDRVAMSGVDAQERAQHGADVAVFGIGAVADLCPEFRVNTSKRELVRIRSVGRSSSSGGHMASVCPSPAGLQGVA